MKKKPEQFCGNSKMGSIILAGGRSSRLGQDKSALIIAGETLLQRTINLLGQLGGEIVLVLAPEQSPPLLDNSPKVTLATDKEFGKGPLVGIYSGLKASKETYNLVVACDMPFLNVNLLKYMMGLVNGFDVVIPRTNGEIEPLHAIYSQRCLGVIAEMIAENDLKVRNLLDKVKSRYVEVGEIDRFDPHHMSWFNINTPNDLKKAERIINRELEK